MTYRSDLEAAVARADALQSELDRLRPKPEPAMKFARPTSVRLALACVVRCFAAFAAYACPLLTVGVLLYLALAPLMGLVALAPLFILVIFSVLSVACTGDWVKKNVLEQSAKTVTEQRGEEIDSQKT